MALLGLTLRRKYTGSAELGLVLFIAGGASNWIDRVLRGSVVDFLNVGIGPLRTGVFNMSDVAIMVGAGARSKHRMNIDRIVDLCYFARPV